ncbi:nuclear transport factor 2 family protein [Virgibacillus ainsalahensis]
MNISNSESEGIKIICREDCGNSPRKKLLQEFNIAFVKNDTDFIINHIADDINWNMIGDKMIHGNKQFNDMMKQMEDRKINEIHIKNIITHGKTAAVNGSLDVEGMGNYDFCDIYNFSSAGKNSKIKEITSYIIKES